MIQYKGYLQFLLHHIFYMEHYVQLAYGSISK